MSYRLIVSRAPEQVILGAQSLCEIAHVLHVPGPVKCLSMHAAAFDVLNNAEGRRGVFQLLQLGYGVRLDLEHQKRIAAISSALRSAMNESIWASPAVASPTRSEEQPGRSPGS